MAARKPRIDWNDSLADFKKGITNAAKNNPIIGQNIKYFQSAQRGAKDVVKTAATDIAVSAAGAAAGRVVGAASAKLGQVVGGKVAVDVAETAFSKISAGLEKSSQGGKVFKTNTPFGPTLASTKIMSPAQRQAAIGGLAKVAANRATEIGAEVGSKAASIVSKSANVASKTVVANTVKAVEKKTNKRK